MSFELETIITIPTFVSFISSFSLIKLIHVFEIYIFDFNIFLLCKFLLSNLIKSKSYPFFDIVFNVLVRKLILVKSNSIVEFQINVSREKHSSIFINISSSAHCC